MTPTHNKIPKISIVTVVKNDAANLQKTILSVSEQTYDSIEHVIVDGASTDETIDVIKNSESRISSWISEPDTGIYDAMNKGLRMATGTYILFLNAGDTLVSKETLCEVITAVQNLPTLPKIVYGGTRVYSESGRFLTTLKPLTLSKRNLNMFATRVVCHQSVLVHSDILIPYNEEYSLKGELDWYYSLLKKVSSNEMLKIDECISNYYLGGASYTRHRENYREMIRVVRDHNNILSFVLFTPFFLIPILFRFKQYILNIYTK